LRPLSPATVSPTLESMPPNARHNPAVEPAEELSDVGSLVRPLTWRRVPLKTKELIEELNPVLRRWGHYYLIHESPDRFLTGKSAQPPHWVPLRILPGGNRSCLPRLILYPRNSNPCWTSTIRVFCGCNRSFRIRSAAATAGRDFHPRPQRVFQVAPCANSRKLLCFATFLVSSHYLAVEFRRV
jgi:hypothetical protein